MGLGINEREERFKDNICIVSDRIHDNIESLLQLLTKARELADAINMNVTVIGTDVLEEDDKSLIEEYGADCIYCCKNKVEHDTSVLLLCLEKAFTKIQNIKMVLFVSTCIGQELAARVSIRHKVGLTAECINIKYENNQFIFVRAAMNSSVIASIVSVNSKFGMCTIKHNVFKKRKCKIKHSMTIHYINECNISQVNNNKYIIESIEQKLAQAVYFDNARVIFGCGRGVINSGCLELFKKAAQRYNAEIACTRPLVENGIFPYERQVGQSGVSIAPKIYVAFGISGASQHIIGILNTDTVIAINNDVNAPIFEHSNYKVVYDVREVLENI
jgi:electron transfer flavoprotein alpha subunit